MEHPNTTSFVYAERLAMIACTQSRHAVRKGPAGRTETVLTVTVVVNKQANTLGLHGGLWQLKNLKPIPNWMNLKEDLDLPYVTIGEINSVGPLFLPSRVSHGFHFDNCLFLQCDTRQQPSGSTWTVSDPPCR